MVEAARIPTGIFTVESPTSPPLSSRERQALIRILGMSAESSVGMAPRRKAALQAYLDVLSTPPLIPDQVLQAARALIRTWAEVGIATSSYIMKRTPDPTVRPRNREILQATLLELDPNVEASTEMLSPMGMTDVFERYGYL